MKRRPPWQNFLLGRDQSTYNRDENIKGVGQLNFDLTEEQKMIRKLMRDFAEGEVAPGADERDRQRHFLKIS